MYPHSRPVEASNKRQKKMRIAPCYTLNGVNGDLIAMEARYHKNCFAMYVSKKSTLGLAKGEAVDSTHKRAFKELVTDLNVGIEQGRAHNMMSGYSYTERRH